MLNGSFKAEVAQVMLQEMTNGVQYVCKKHYMLAVSYYCFEDIKELKDSYVVFRCCTYTGL